MKRVDSRLFSRESDPFDAQILAFLVACAKQRRTKKFKIVTEHLDSTYVDAALDRLMDTAINGRRSGKV
jgi:hypothetical protein